MSTPLDAVERRRRQSASTVKRLRDQVGSDPSRVDALGDALVGLTGERLLAWDWTEAATDAAESVLTSARILAAGGTGPYTRLPDAVRFFSASAHLATVQVQLGQPGAAARTLEQLDAWSAQLGDLPLATWVGDAPATWALLARGSAVFADDPAAASSLAEAALTRIYAAGLQDEPAAAYLAMTGYLLLADCRWATGYPEASLALHRLAHVRHRTALGGWTATTSPATSGGQDPATGTAMSGGPRLRPAVAQIAWAPFAALYPRHASRLTGYGNHAAAVALLREGLGLIDRFGDPSGVLAAQTWAGLASALASAGRTVEASSARVRAEEVARQWEVNLAEPAPAPTPGTRVAWQPPATDPGLTPERFAAGLAGWRSDEHDSAYQQAAEWAGIEADEARRRAGAEREAALATAERDQADRAAADAEARERHRTEAQARAEEESAAARRAEEDAAARAEAAQRRDALARERRERADARTIAAASAELAEARELAAAPVGDLAGQARAQEWLARVLRPLASVDPGRYAPELAVCLEALVSLRWRLGDADGSREAAREAKALASR